MKKIDEIKKRKKTPILVGGTGLYFKALTDGLVNIPNIPINIRDKIRAYQFKIGQKQFYKKLLELDPASKNKINPTDPHRSIRAYEVKLCTKKSIHEWYKNTKSIFQKSDFYKIYINFPRLELIERINLRSKEMIENGAIKEVKNFIKLKVKKDKSVNKAIGINEIRQYLNNEKKLEDIIENISIKTRQYSKRQSIWARGNWGSWHKLNPSELNKFLKKI